MFQSSQLVPSEISMVIISELRMGGTWLIFCVLGTWTIVWDHLD